MGIFMGKLAVSFRDGNSLGDSPTSPSNGPPQITFNFGGVCPPTSPSNAKKFHRKRHLSRAFGWLPKPSNPMFFLWAFSHQSRHLRIFFFFECNRLDTWAVGAVWWENIQGTFFDMTCISVISMQSMRLYRLYFVIQKRHRLNY